MYMCLTSTRQLAFLDPCYPEFQVEKFTHTKGILVLAADATFTFT